MTGKEDNVTQSIFTEKEVLVWLVMDLRNISTKIFKKLQTSERKDFSDIAINDKDLSTLKRLCKEILLQPVIEKCQTE